MNSTEILEISICMILNIANWYDVKMTKMTINHYIYLCYNSIYFFDLIVGKIKNIVVNKLQ